MKSIITDFFKAVWLKYYNFIQWTKKWHFCHFVIWSTWVGIVWLYLFALMMLPEGFIHLLRYLDKFIINPLMYIEEFIHNSMIYLGGFIEKALINLLEFIEVHCYIIRVSSLFFLIVTAPSAIIKMIISFYKNKTVFVTSEFLISNKKYNIAYVITLSFLIIAWFFGIQMDYFGLFMIPTAS